METTLNVNKIGYALYKAYPGGPESFRNYMSPLSYYYYNILGRPLPTKGSGLDVEVLKKDKDFFFYYKKVVPAWSKKHTISKRTTIDWPFQCLSILSLVYGPVVVVRVAEFSVLLFCLLFVTWLSGRYPKII